MFQATDDEGKGQTTVVPLRITLIDANDNPPVFNNKNYRAVIDEGAKKFEPELIVMARDADKTSEIKYSILSGNTNNLFNIESDSGKILINDPNGLDMTNVTTDNVVLTIEVSFDTFINFGKHISDDHQLFTLLIKVNLVYH